MTLLSHPVVQKRPHRTKTCRRILPFNWPLVVAGFFLSIEAVWSPLRATQPDIYLFEKIGAYWLIHFNTDANRAYTVQYRNSTTDSWKTLGVPIPAKPFADHYIAADLASTNKMRFYRLVVTP